MRDESREVRRSGREGRLAITFLLVIGGNIFDAQMFFMNWRKQSYRRKGRGWEGGSRNQFPKY